MFASMLPRNAPPGLHLHMKQCKPLKRRGLLQATGGTHHTGMLSQFKKSYIPTPPSPDLDGQGQPALRS